MNNYNVTFKIIDKTKNVARLKDYEDWSILNLGGLHSKYGLNRLNEVKQKSRIPQFNKRYQLKNTPPHLTNLG